jgi:hypothetical protein
MKQQRWSRKYQGDARVPRRLDVARLGPFQDTDVFYAATKPRPTGRTGPSSWSATATSQAAIFLHETESSRRAQPPPSDHALRASPVNCGCPGAVGDLTRLDLRLVAGKLHERHVSNLTGGEGSLESHFEWLRRLPWRKAPTMA